MNTPSGRRYTRYISTQSLFQAHASPDAHYVILPVLENSSVIKGWVIYDSVKGEILRPDSSPGWTSVFEAKEHIEHTFYDDVG